MAYGWAWLRALATVGEGVGTSWARLPGRVPRRAFSRSARHGPELMSAGEGPPGRVPGSMAYGWAWLRALATAAEGAGTSWARPPPGRVPRRAFRGAPDTDRG
jgi:hypothetical protein